MFDVDEINEAIGELADKGEVSDGYHTFDELYDHRITLWIALCRERSSNVHVWRSTVHSDGTSYSGWFALGMYSTPGRQITYHLPLERWDETGFAETLDFAPEFDGHTSDDVLDRLKNLPAGENCRRMLSVAKDALSSYKFGNSSPDLAAEIVEAIEKVLEGEG